MLRRAFKHANQHSKTPHCTCFKEKVRLSVVPIMQHAVCQLALSLGWLLSVKRFCEYMWVLFRVCVKECMEATVELVKLMLTFSWIRSMMSIILLLNSP